MSPSEYGYVLGMVIGVMLIGLIPTIFFLITQQNTLKSIQPANRLMEPGMVWLQLIPLFGLVWQFIVVTRISDSIRREFNSWQDENSILGYSDGESMRLSHRRPTYDIGLTYCILFCCSIVPVLGSLAALAGFVCWIIYWVKLAECKRMLKNRGF